MIRMLIALLGGMLIGLERERAQLSAKGKSGKTGGSIPGMRSFGLLSLFGALSSYTLTLGESLGEILWGYILLLGFIGVLLIVLIYAYTRMVVLKIQGVTTYIVMLVTFISGALAGAGLILESAGTSVLVALTLAMKYPAEKAASAISYNELLAMIEVGALALILGPIVKAVSDSLGVSLVYKSYIFFIVILIISFTTYMSARMWGGRGLLYATVLGALVNSEATIASLTRSIAAMAREEEIAKRAVKGLTPLVIVVAQIKLIALGLIGVVIITGTIPYRLVAYLSLISLYTVALAYIVSTHIGKEVTSGLTVPALEVTSPLSWSTAIKSAVAYAVIAGALIGVEKMGLSGLTLAPVAISFIGGLVSATAVILSLGTAMTAVGECIVGASIMAVLAAVSLNKILYVKTAGARPALSREVYKWSIVLSIAPLAFMALIMLYC
ncbi:MAG: DUF4010 domain-containing protein [Desulfurococcales archaeon]|nr:DUF4010 domain-containing protein [Desulfurococcales archaeon]